ncbi:hypothetical protein C3397_13610 [Enterobacter cloacae complex sp. ECNIH16]|nr:hypothetical protein C3394_14200 [Enterobacter cloacae complex sp. ECNIH11]POV44228.1 hypothetical protein C3397_13610 [Enterobacter cloacae complex sp. ECNIH16]
MKITCAVKVSTANFPSSFTLQMRWLHLFTPVTYLYKLPGIHRFAAFLQREILRERGRAFIPSPCGRGLG